jgi:threonylcarbamoyladenosine tRNA methylthiotransferase MtaB
LNAEVISLGCRLNIAESESIRALLTGEHDVVVVNSCAVTAEAVRHTRQAIRRARRARPHARLLVTGCAADIDRELLAAMPEVDGLVPNAAKLDARACQCGRRRSRPNIPGLSSRCRTAATMPAPFA